MPRLRLLIAPAAPLLALASPAVARPEAARHPQVRGAFRVEATS